MIWLSVDLRNFSSMSGQDLLSLASSTLARWVLDLFPKGVPGPSVQCLYIHIVSLRVSSTRSCHANARESIELSITVSDLNTFMNVTKVKNIIRCQWTLSILPGTFGLCKKLARCLSVKRCIANVVEWVALW